MALVLHSGKGKNVYKALIAAEYIDVKVQLVENFEMGVSNKTPGFLKMNPIGKVPLLETPEGPIFESNAIARYVTHLKPNNSLFGSSPIEYGQIEQWIDFSSLEIDANLLAWYWPRRGRAVYLPPAEEAAISAVKRALGALNTHLASNTYLVGHSVTLADIITTCNLYVGFKVLMTKSFTAEFPHVERYFWTMINQPNFKKIFGEVTQTESVPPVPSTKKPAQPKEAAKPKPKEEPKKKEVPKEAPKPEEEEEAPKPKPKNPLDLLPPSTMVLDDWKRLYSNTKTNFREVAIKAKKPAQPKEAAKPKPKEEPKKKEVRKEAPKPEEEEDAPKPKPKNPLDLLLPSTMVLDDWKRLYSNTKTNFREVAIEGFWDMYDPEGYSLWFCNYKYNDENTVSFVTLNKVGGFLQRMDLARKYAFGKMLVIGSEAPYKVKGIWLFRGKEIPKFIMDECYDMELYDWTKVDITDEAQKERVSQMIEDQEPFEGEALLDAKCFK